VCRLQCVGVATTSASAAAARAATPAEANTMPVWLCIRFALALALSVCAAQPLSPCDSPSPRLLTPLFALVLCAIASPWLLVHCRCLLFVCIVRLITLANMFLLLRQTSLCKVHLCSECSLWPLDLCVYVCCRSPFASQFTQIIDTRIVFSFCFSYTFVAKNCVALCAASVCQLASPSVTQSFNRSIADGQTATALTGVAYMPLYGCVCVCMYLRACLHVYGSFANGVGGQRPRRKKKKKRNH